MRHVGVAVFLGCLLALLVPFTTGAVVPPVAVSRRAAQTLQNMDFGAISGVVLNDTRGDGLLMGVETPMYNVTIVLTDLLGLPVTATKTDMMGKFKFVNMPPNHWRVNIIPPENYLPSIPAIGFYELDVHPGKLMQGTTFALKMKPRPRDFFFF
eukprot:comp18841_c1_seq1/m.20854 comp18841_c1_seq1/g.20854  ORF comp18841_c1_seq1/g.20854 comp18841_c1_seq1/m.20854 type:complete len:154 (-) comp18841_c1_seq1:293-754(-)